MAASASSSSTGPMTSMPLLDDATSSAQPSRNCGPGGRMGVNPAVDAAKTIRATPAHTHARGAHRAGLAAGVHHRPGKSAGGPADGDEFGVCGDVAARGLVAALGEDITVRANEDGAEGSIPVGARLHGEFDAAPSNAVSSSVPMRSSSCRMPACTGPGGPERTLSASIARKPSISTASVSLGPRRRVQSPTTDAPPAAARVRRRRRARRGRPRSGRQ